MDAESKDLDLKSRDTPVSKTKPASIKSSRLRQQDVRKVEWENKLPKNEDPARDERTARSGSEIPQKLWTRLNRMRTDQRKFSGTHQESQYALSYTKLSCGRTTLTLMCDD